jgi:hypothetical protein
MLTLGPVATRFAGAFPWLLCCLQLLLCLSRPTMFVGCEPHQTPIQVRCSPIVILHYPAAHKLHFMLLSCCGGSSCLWSVGATALNRKVGASWLWRRLYTWVCWVQLGFFRGGFGPGGSGGRIFHWGLEGVRTEMLLVVVVVWEGGVGDQIST